MPLKNPEPEKDELIELLWRLAIEDSKFIEGERIFGLLGRMLLGLQNEIVHLRKRIADLEEGRSCDARRPGEGA